MSKDLLKLIEEIDKFMTAAKAKREREQADVNEALEAVKCFETFYIATIQRKLGWRFKRTAKALSKLESDKIIEREGHGKPYRKLT